MNNYVPKVQDVRTVTRYDILKQLLEHQNPAFVFYTVMSHLSPRKLNETVSLCERYGEMLRYIRSVCESDIIEDKANSTGHDSLSLLGGGYSRFTGGKGHSAYEKHNEAFWKRVGEKIADMEGNDKRDYSGMMNLLQSSCYMHNVIMQNVADHTRNTYNTPALIKDLDKHLASNSDTQIRTTKQALKRSEAAKKGAKTRKKNKKEQFKQDLINKALGGDEESKSYLRRWYRKDYDKYFNESLYKAIFNGYSLNEAKDSFKKMDSMTKLDDYVNMMSYALSQLSDEEVLDIDDELSNYNALSPYPDREDGGEDDDVEGRYAPKATLMYTSDYMFDNPVPYISLTNDYDGMDNMYQPSCSPLGESHNSKFTDHPERGNGKGGLKSLVGKNAGDDLTDEDLLNIAARINSLYDSSTFNAEGGIEEYDPDFVQAMASVNFMGSTCLIFQYIRRGLLDNLKKKAESDLKRKFRGNWDRGNLDARDNRLTPYTKFGNKPMLGVDKRRRGF